MAPGGRVAAQLLIVAWVVAILRVPVWWVKALFAIGIVAMLWCMRHPDLFHRRRAPEPAAGAGADEVAPVRPTWVEPERWIDHSSPN